MPTDPFGLARKGLRTDNTATGTKSPANLPECGASWLMRIFPKVLRPLLLAAAECGVRAVRNPFGPRLPLRLSELLKRPDLWTRWAEMRVLGTFAGKFQKAVQREGFATPDGTLGIEVTGTLNETLFAAIANSVPEGDMGVRLPSWLQRL
jgi:hypothetical protein